MNEKPFKSIKTIGFNLFLFIVLSINFTPSYCSAVICKVLTVMSYEEDNPWCEEIKEGIDSVLAPYCEVKYFYMDTKKDISGGIQKAKQAYELYQTYQPDGVISADDNAQSMFVVPFLKDKVKTPVMFCGVNGTPEKYDYPASNVSGILERGHIMQSLAFAKQILPSIQSVGFIAKKSPSGKALFRQVNAESDTYLLKLVDFKMVSTVIELVAVAKQFQQMCDVVFIDSVEGIVDRSGRSLKNKKIVEILAKHFRKPIIGANHYHVEQGAMCAVVKTGQNQGSEAAQMLLKAMQGTSVSALPITVNRHGKRVINISTMKALGIHTSRRAMIGAKLLK